eukprot:504243-Prymnesium_polylepis.1
MEEEKRRMESGKRFGWPAGKQQLQPTVVLYFTAAVATEGGERDGTTRRRLPSVGWVGAHGRVD